MIGAAPDRDAALAAYEQLRQHALTGSANDAPGGLVWLLRDGVAAWLIRRAALEAAPDPLAVGPKPRAVACPALDEIQAGIVGVLAGMALAARERNA